MITFKKGGFLFFIVLLFVSLAANIYLVFQLRQSIKLVEAQKINLKILAFRNMFTQKVLLADGEVDFDTRLTLENAVRALNDQEIFDQWEKAIKLTKNQKRNKKSLIWCKIYIRGF